MSSDEVQECCKTLQPRFESIKTVVVTRSHHRFVPINRSTVSMHRLSCDTTSTQISISTDFVRAESEQILPALNISTGQYVSVIYDEKWYIGIVSEQSQEHGDVVINFLTQNVETMTFTWPPRKDEYAVPYKNVLSTVPAPLPTGNTGRQYKLASTIVEDIVKKFEEHKIMCK